MEKKRSIVEWAMHYRSIVILTTSLLVAFGIVALKNINKNEFPDITIRQGIVVAVYPGASPQEVENQLTKPLEQYIFTFKEVKKEKTKSTSKNGMCIIQVELNDDLQNKDEFWSKFKHGVQQFKSSLPTGVLALVVQDDFGDTSTLLITLESNDKTYRELRSYINDLKDSLQTIESVGRLSVYGLANEQVSVYIDTDKLSHYALSDKTIALNLFQKGFVTTSGTVKNQSGNYPVYVSRGINVVSDVENLVVHSDANGNVVRLKDIAEVRREYPCFESYITNNGKKCILLSVEVKKGRNVVSTGHQIYQKLDNFERSLPEEVSIFRITDQAQVVEDSVFNFLEELLIAVSVVILVVILLMPIRVALVAASTIPISIFISLALFYLLGIELNTVTLAALIVTLGMIVDNSIVIIDSYVEKLAEGMSRWHAAIWSAEHYFKAILSATLAISITFFPFLATATGVTADFLKLFPWSITIVLMVSLMVAELVVPFLQFFFIRKPLKSASNGENKFSFLNVLQNFYNKVVDLCFRFPKTVIVLGILSIVVGIMMLSSVPQRSMPYADRNQFAVEIYLPEGSPVEKTAVVADSVKKIFEKESDVVSVAEFIGCSSPRFHTAYAPQVAGENYAQFVVNTTGVKQTVKLIDKYSEYLLDYFPEAYVRLKQISYSSDDNPIEVRIYGEDYSKVRLAADTVVAIMKRDPVLRMVRQSTGGVSAGYNVDVDYDNAARLGISAATVEQALAMRYNSGGISVASIWDGDYEIPISIISPVANNADAQTMQNEQVPVLGGLSQTPLRQFATIKPEWENSQITHRGGIRLVTISADVMRGKNSLNAILNLQQRLENLQLPEGVSIVWGGETESSAETNEQMGGAMMMAIAIIFFILLMHFKRMRTPFLLLSSLLLCLFGTAVGLLVMGIDFSVTCMLGIVSLMGILVRNGIIMYDYAEELRSEEKLLPRDAIILSAKRRMRPIFLTSAAASMGVVPMILGQSGLWMPMGTVVFFGTLITMVFILTVLPVAYMFIMKNTVKIRQKGEDLEKE